MQKNTSWRQQMKFYWCNQLIDGTRKKDVQKPACFLELFTFIADNLDFIVCIHRKSIFILWILVLDWIAYKRRISMPASKELLLRQQSLRHLPYPQYINHLKSLGVRHSYSSIQLIKFPKSEDAVHIWKLH